MKPDLEYILDGFGFDGNYDSIVNTAWVEYEDENIALIEMDFKIKNMEECGIVSYEDDTSAYINGVMLSKEDLFEDGSFLEIYFPKYRDWKIWSSTFSRYTLYVTMYNSRKLPKK